MNRTPLKYLSNIISHSWIPSTMPALHALQRVNLHQDFHLVPDCERRVTRTRRVRTVADIGGVDGTVVGRYRRRRLSDERQVILVVSTATGLLDVAQIDAALVAESVDVGAARRPGDRGHRAAALVVPAANVDDSADLSSTAVLIAPFPVGASLDLGSYEDPLQRHLCTILPGSQWDSEIHFHFKFNFHLLQVCKCNYDNIT